mmetsp:Transcript_106221/g.298698  ORF Transcript_106221/g.298698 Transcript_106221/m.298698 type:complete len:225 (+) Transcript_106221:608-1282(+)
MGQRMRKPRQDPWHCEVEVRAIRFPERLSQRSVEHLEQDEERPEHRRQALIKGPAQLIAQVEEREPFHRVERLGQGDYFKEHQRDFVEALKVRQSATVAQQDRVHDLRKFCALLAADRLVYAHMDVPGVDRTLHVGLDRPRHLALGVYVVEQLSPRGVCVRVRLWAEAQEERPDTVPQFRRAEAVPSEGKVLQSSEVEHFNCMSDLEGLRLEGLILLCPRSAAA